MFGQYFIMLCFEPLDSPLIGQEYELHWVSTLRGPVFWSGEQSTKLLTDALITLFAEAQTRSILLSAQGGRTKIHLSTSDFPHDSVKQF